MHAILIFSEPVVGPVLLGAGRYRGYGLCRPLRGRGMTDFPTFFSSLWASEKWPEPQPFPWQTMLAEGAQEATGQK